MDNPHAAYEHRPTRKWLRGRNPETEKELEVWYKREKQALDIRRHQTLKRRFSFETYFDNRKVKEEQEIILNLWKLSEQDYLIYLKWLDERFEKLKIKIEGRKNGQ